MTKLILYLCLPALIFYSFLSRLSWDNFQECSFFLALSFAILSLGFLTGWTFFKFFSQNSSLKREFVSLNMFQNSGYLPLALSAYIFQGAERELAYLYIFSYLIGFNLVMLSFGFYYIKRDSRLNFKDLVSVPFLVSLLGVTFALSGLGEHFPALLLEPIHKLGEATIPLSMLLLGMTFAGSDLFSGEHLKELFLLLASKLIFLPLIFIFILRFISLPPLMKLITFLESAMPSATTLIIIANYKEANVRFVSQGIILTHIFLIFTLPALSLLL